eukprot:Em0001g1197a
MVHLTFSVSAKIEKDDFIAAVVRKWQNQSGLSPMAQQGVQIPQYLKEMTGPSAGLHWSKAFNSIRCDKMFLAVRSQVTEPYPHVQSAYCSSTSLFWGDKPLIDAGAGRYSFCVVNCDTDFVTQLFEEDQGKTAKYSWCFYSNTGQHIDSDGCCTAMMARMWAATKAKTNCYSDSPLLDPYGLNPCVSHAFCEWDALLMAL